MDDTNDSVNVITRAEHIVDLIMYLRNPMLKIFQDLWDKVYRNDNIPKTKWLQQFQLSLKVTKDLSDDEIADKLSHKRHILNSLYEAILLTGVIHHDVTLHITRDKTLLYHFFRDCVLQVARELWAKPYLMYNLTHKKHEVEAARDTLEKIIATSIKHEIRSYTEDLVVTEEERIEKCNEIMDMAPAPVATYHERDNTHDYNHGNDNTHDYNYGNEEYAQHNLVAESPAASVTQQMPVQLIISQPHSGVASPIQAQIIASPTALAAALAGHGTHSSPLSPAHSAKHKSPATPGSPAHSVLSCSQKSIDIMHVQQNDRSLSDQLDSPKAADIFDYVPLKTDSPRKLSRTSSISSLGRGQLPTASGSRKSIALTNDDTTGYRTTKHDHKDDLDYDDTSSDSSSSDESNALVVQKKNKATKPKVLTSLNKYSHYRNNQTAQALMKKHTSSNGKSHQPTFFR